MVRHIRQVESSKNMTCADDGRLGASLKWATGSDDK